MLIAIKLYARILYLTSPTGLQPSDSSQYLCQTFFNKPSLSFQTQNNTSPVVTSNATPMNNASISPEFTARSRLSGTAQREFLVDKISYALPRPALFFKTLLNMSSLVIFYQRNACYNDVYSDRERVKIFS